MLEPEPSATPKPSAVPRLVTPSREIKIDSDVTGLLVHEGVAIGGCVGGERAVPVEMIVGDVQEGAHPGLKRGRALQLEARDLDDQVVPGLARGVAQGRAEVASAKRLATAGPQHSDEVL